MIVTVLFPSKQEVVPQKVEKDLVWYDAELRKMRTFKGGKLEFEYGYDEELEKHGFENCWRMKPKVVDVMEDIRIPTVDRERITKWFSQYENYNNTHAEVVGQSVDGVDFEVPDREADDFMYDCERNGLMTRI